MEPQGYTSHTPPPPFDDIENLKREAGLRPYEERLGDLRRCGKQYTATCPFHPDSHPSLNVYPEDGQWLHKCFPCGEKAGDVIDFVRKADGVDFVEAVRLIGGTRPATRTTPAGKSAPRAARPAFKLDRATAAAQIGRAEEFLAGRGISMELARQAGLGVADYPGVGPMIVLPYGTGPDSPVKLRALPPADKKETKWRQIEGYPTNRLLYGIEQVEPGGEVWVAESELDALTLRAHGFAAVSVSHAGCVANGKLTIEREHLEILRRASRIFVVTDMDSAGEKCAAAFAAEFPSSFRVSWPFEGKDSLKDIGELYAKLRYGFRAHIATIREEIINRPPAWRKLFKCYDEMEDGDLEFLIKGFLPEGVCFIGGCSGAGKTWIGLSMAKALTTGRSFLKLFEVPAVVPVIYLIPESGERAFKLRAV